MIKHARIAASLATMLVAVAVAAGLHTERAEAGAEVCTPCVLVIEVDGLEAKDVSAATTPFLWALAHPDAAKYPESSAAAIGAAQTPYITGRAGFVWEAARGTMTATTGAATASLITGGYADQSGVYGDEYYEANASKSLRLGSDGSDGSEDLDTDAKTLPDLVLEQTESKAGSWLGDPKLANLLGESVQTPTQNESIPLYCPFPRDQDEAKAYQDQGQNISCPTADNQILNRAETDLIADTKGGRMSFGYIYLAELGVMKRFYGDPDSHTTPAGRAVASQLALTDAAIGAFVNRYGRDATEKWNNTVLMVVGNHGYELTPVSHRVPDPEVQGDASVGNGLADVVTRNGGKFVAQGTMGTVYLSSHDPATLKRIADKIKSLDNPTTGSSLCLAGSQANLVDDPSTTVQAGCIEAIYATGAVDANGNSLVQGYDSIQKAYPGWRLHFAKDGKPSGADGDLLVVLRPGWAAGPLVPLKSGPDDTFPDPFGVYSGDAQVKNPFVGSAGGPRNRAIAAIVNGRADMVRQVQGAGAYPVSSRKLNDEACPTAFSDYAPPVADSAAPEVNANPADDANDKGHECQAETVDFAPTIAALLRLSMSDTQLGGRFLQEAFQRPLGFPRTEEIQQDFKQDDPPPPIEPDIDIPKQPPPPKSFLYTGLVQKIKVNVSDKHGCTWDVARPGSKMEYLRIEGDFGKQYSSTTLTFYRKAQAPAPAAPAATAAANRPRYCLKAKRPKIGKARAAARKAKSAGRPPLSAIARFNPFLLKRGHVVLKLKIPELYRPTHLGLFVQEAHKFDVPPVGPDGNPGVNFEGFGPAAGKIVQVRGGNRLHAVKPGGRAKRG